MGVVVVVVVVAVSTRHSVQPSAILRNVGSCMNYYM